MDDLWLLILLLLFCPCIGIWGVIILLLLFSDFDTPCNRPCNRCCF